MSADPTYAAAVRARGLAYYYKKHEANKARARVRYRTKPRRQSRVLRRLGISFAQFDATLEAQGHCCACCGVDAPGCKKGWVPDHDHDTNVFRGVLAWPCNVLLGQLGDNATGVARVCLRFLRYLAKTGDLPTEAVRLELLAWLRGMPAAAAA